MMLMAAISFSCADDLMPQFKKEHIHNIVNVDTTHQYKLRWFCGDCRQWFNTVDLYRINYSLEFANEKMKHEKISHR